MATKLHRSKSSGLTKRCETFVRLYHSLGAKHGVAAQSYRAAGFSPKFAKENAAKVLRRPNVLKFLAQLNEESGKLTRERFKAAAPHAADDLIGLVGTAKKDDGNRIKAATTVLGMAGLASIQQSEVTHLHEHRIVLTQEQIDAKLTAMLERRQDRALPLTIDLTPEKE
jgi:phage terminase small subunit